MECERSWNTMSDLWTQKLEPYLDGELSPEEIREVDAHLRSCPACGADVLRHLKMKHGLKAAGRRFTASPELKLRVRQRIAPRRNAFAIWRWAAPVVAVLLVAVVLYFVRDRAQAQYAAAELADLHVATLASATP